MAILGILKGLGLFVPSGMFLLGSDWSDWWPEIHSTSPSSPAQKSMVAESFSDDINLTTGTSPKNGCWTFRGWDLRSSNVGMEQISRISIAHDRSGSVCYVIMVCHSPSTYIGPQWDVSASIMKTAMDPSWVVGLRVISKYHLRCPGHHDKAQGATQEAKVNGMAFSMARLSLQDNLIGLFGGFELIPVELTLHLFESW